MSETPPDRSQLRSHRRGRRRRGAAVLVALLVVALVATGVAGWLVVIPALQPAVHDDPVGAGPVVRPPVNPAFEPRPIFDMNAHSIDDPTSLWVVVNKLRPLDPEDFVPPDLVPVPVPFVNQPFMRSEAADAAARMFAAFGEESGLQMQALSTYRSYSSQQAVYGGNDLLTARPGFSEHQTGWVIDVDAQPRVCSLQACFANTPQGMWLAAHAWEHGFILRYPDGLTSITGYQFEPWHFRYVGVELATEMRDRGILTLEEFFGLSAAPDYR